MYRCAVSRAWFVQVLVLGLSGMLLVSSNASAADPVAMVASRSGDVSIQRNGTAGFQAVTSNAELYAGDTLATGSDGRATLLLNDESLVQINNNTRLVLKSVDQSAGWLPAAAKSAVGSVYEMLQGELWFRNKNPGVNLEIETPQVAIGVRGTEFVVRVTPGATEVDMLEGRVVASNPLGSIDAESGEQIYAVNGAPPRKRLLINPENAVQWTVLVPPLLSAEAAAINDTSGDRYRIASELFTVLERDGPGAARRELDSALIVQPDDPFMLTASAWLDINSGKAATASVELAAITAAHPDEAYAWQVYALALLITNRADEALAAIDNAKRLAPTSAETYVVESYVQQALFNFPGAQVAIDQALSLDPDNLLALVNASQLSFAKGEIGAAKSYAEQAIAVDGGNVNVLNLIGFLKLAENKTQAAIEHFEQALAVDSEFAEAYLGLGLGRVRQNNIDEALEAITTAVALDPTRSMYMSYWGRVLYQLGRHERALQVLERAAELDPRDPTPWYLQAVVLRDMFLYGEAIQHYNRAVELNDNTAVYRSKFLLDQDAALRSVDLSLIFQEYNFDAWADRKAVGAVNEDYGDFSAHLMYAGALQNQENREVAFLSETLQNRILAPGNQNSFNTFNQYTSFLDKPSLQGNARIQDGSFNQKAVEGELFGALPDESLAFQAAYTDASSDGWNGFNGDEIRDFSTILKWDATIKDRFMFAFSDFELTVYDDLDRRFEYDDVPRPDYQTDTTLQRYELGYSHNFRVGADLMAYVAYIENKAQQQFTEIFNDFSEPYPPNPSQTFLDFETGTQFQENDWSSWQAQLAYSMRLDQHELIVGTSNYVGKNDVRRTEDVVYTIGLVPAATPPSEFPLPSREVRLEESNDRNFYSVYVQDTWTVNDWLDLEGALYYDYMKNSQPLVDDSWTIKELNPRLGAVIRAGEIDTFRLAAYRYLAPFFSAQISPTEIAGLTIFRNSQEGALVKEADISWERNWSTGFSSVNGFLMRSETEGRPVPDIQFVQGPGKFDTPFVFVGDGNYDGIEMNLNQQLGNRWGLVGRYFYADIDSDWEPDTARYEQRVEAGLTLILPTGIFAGISQGYRYLDMKNRTSNEAMNYTNVELTYQLRNRMALIKVTGENIFDNNFNWVTDRFTLGGIVPRRYWLVSFEVNL